MSRTLLGICLGLALSISVYPQQPPAQAKSKIWNAQCMDNWYWSPCAGGRLYAWDNGTGEFWLQNLGWNKDTAPAGYYAGPGEIDQIRLGLPGVTSISDLSVTMVRGARKGDPEDWAITQEIDGVYGGYSAGWTISGLGFTPYSAYAVLVGCGEPPLHHDPDLYYSSCGDGWLRFSFSFAGVMDPSSAWFNTRHYVGAASYPNPDGYGTPVGWDGGRFFDSRDAVSVAPEPASLLLLGCGLFGVAVVARRRRQ